MKNRNKVLIVTLAALAFAFAPVVQAAPSPDGGPTRLPADDRVTAANEGTPLPPGPEPGESAVVTIHNR
jgi:hypothetical protein